MRAKQDMVVIHVAEGEGWKFVSRIRHHGGSTTTTYTSPFRGVVHVREFNGEIKGVSWLNTLNENVTVTLNCSDMFALALSVLTGERQ